MKLDNLLYSRDGLKIADFGTAIILDDTMKLPFTFRKTYMYDIICKIYSGYITVMLSMLDCMVILSML